MSLVQKWMDENPELTEEHREQLFRLERAVWYDAYDLILDKAQTMDEEELDEIRAAQEDFEREFEEGMADDPLVMLMEELDAAMAELVEDMEEETEEEAEE